MNSTLSNADLQNTRAAWRARLLAERQEVRARRAPLDDALRAHLASALLRLRPHCVGLYWPIRGEIDVRDCVADWLAQAPDARQAALPVVDAPHQPLRFRQWRPETALTAGRYGIPVPADGAWRVPDLLLIPCVGFSIEADGRAYRLGYGGGFYDRTLATLTPRPLALGIAHADAQLPTLHPAAHDMPLDAVICERGVVGAIGGATS